MTKSEIRTRSLSPRDSSKLPCLLENVWGHKTGETYWKWKFFRYPFDKEGIVFENRNGDIVGFIGFWIRPTHCGEGTYVPYMGVDLMVDLTCRNMGISRDIHKKISTLLKGNESYFGFTNPLSHRLHIKYLSEYLTINCNLLIMTAVISGGRYLNYSKTLSVLFSGLTRRAHILRLQIERDNGIEIERCQEIGEEFERLWENLRGDYFWIQNRGQKYLEWRYLSAPHRRYQLWKAVENGKIVGYLVTTIRRDLRMVKGFLVDWLVPRKRPDIFKALVKGGLMGLIGGNVDLIEVWLMPCEKEWKRILQSCLFIKNRRKQSLLFFNTDNVREKDMFLTMGDSDQI